VSRKKNVVKIIGGSWKRKNIFFHDADNLRPTLSRVRETLFNWLGQDLSGKSCLDLFSGSGILGFESLSRNAQSCTLVDNNTPTTSVLIDNKHNLNATNALVVNSTAERFLKDNHEIFDIIFVDPPFASFDVYPLLIEIKNHLGPKGIIYLEMNEPYSTNEFKILKNSKAGKVYFYLLTLNI
jgi:16S rRNA (guanine(966)-N(2))-methyltransferase RsmD